jgi:hypothetical protein
VLFISVEGQIIPLFMFIISSKDYIGVTRKVEIEYDEKSECECVKELVMNGQYREREEKGAVSGLHLPILDKEYA